MIRAFAFLLFLVALPARAEIPIREVASPGGITAWLVEARDIPFVALQIRFKGGTSLDTADKAGAVNLMTALLEEGAGDLDAQGFAVAREALAAEMRFSAGRDTVGVSARFLTENRDAAVALLRTALLTPRFEQTAIDRVRAQILSGLRSEARDPEAIASRRFAEVAFGAHPYGRSGDGTEETVTALTRDDIVAAYRGAMARDRVVVSAVGDIDAQTLGALLDALLGDLPATGAPMPDRIEPALTGVMDRVAHPGPQSVIQFGHGGIGREDPDFIAANVVNEVFGGGRFGSRLMTEVREKRGLTYGIYAALIPQDYATTLMGSVSTANATADEAMAIIRAEWARIAVEGITAEELETVKRYMTGSYPLRFDGNARIAEILVGMQLSGFPIDYPATRNALVEAVTLEDARRVAARLYRPEALTFVVVGGGEGQ